MKTVWKIGKVTLAGLVFAAIVLLVFLWAVPSKGVPADTHHFSWQLVRDDGGEDAADFATCIALATDAGDFGNISSSAYQIRSSGAGEGAHEGYSAGGAMIFAFCGTDTANDTFSFNLVGWARANGMAQVICEGDAILGTQDVVIYPIDVDGETDTAATSAFWADTINLDETTKWPSVATYNASGDNEVAMIYVDMTGLEYVYPYIYDADGTTGVEAVSVAVYGRPY